jgi:hypothetical protein
MRAPGMSAPVEIHFMSGQKRTDETRQQIAARPCVRRQRVHPLTWVAVALLLPLACWDLRQAEYDVHLRHAVSAQRLNHPTVTQRAGAIARLSPIVAARETDAITQ